MKRVPVVHRDRSKQPCDHPVKIVTLVSGLHTLVALSDSADEMNIPLVVQWEKEEIRLTQFDHGEKLHLMLEQLKAARQCMDVEDLPLRHRSYLLQQLFLNT